MATSSTNSSKSAKKLLNTFSSFNVQGLKPQTTLSSIPIIKEKLIENDQLFITLTVTWLNKHHLDAELNIDNYKLFRCDRNGPIPKHGRCSGGVAIYLKKELAVHFQTILEFSNGVNKVLAIYSKEYNMLICVLYRQPDDKHNGNPSGHE